MPPSWNAISTENDTKKGELNQEFNLTVRVQWLTEHEKIIFEQAADVYKWISL